LLYSRQLASLPLVFHITNIYIFFPFIRKKKRGKIFSVAATELGVANEPKKTSRSLCLFILSFVPAKERTKENLSSLQSNS